MTPLSLIEQHLRNRILILDGAMGTSIQELDLSADDFGDESLLGCNEHLVLTRPDVIQTIHEAYFEAGADIVETNTFGATALVLAEYNIEAKAYDINREAVRLARQAAQKFSTPSRPRFVAGSIGPTTKALSVTGGISFDKLAKEFEDQAYSLTQAGADYLLLETALDTMNLKAGYIGILAAFKRLNTEIPIAISVTIETMGSMLAGHGVEALYAAVSHMNPLYIGLNCATGPEFMRDHVRTLASISKYPISVVPNAGIPDENGQYLETPAALAATLANFAEQGWVNVLGGCCGTTPAHIAALAAAVSQKKARQSTAIVEASRLSGIDPLVIENDGRPYIVGERTNVIGSRAFKTMITDEKFEEAAELARKQVRAGAHIIDVCLSNPDRDEISDMTQFLDIVTKYVKVPFMIDSQVPDVVETAFKKMQGKCILNSVNLEEGEKSFQELLPLVKAYGAGIVVGCIEGEMAVTAQQKLDVAIHSHALLTEKYGIAEEDIYFDPLVFPCGTGDVNYFGSGQETIEGVRLIKERFPKCRTVLGISNVSFGLPAAGREVLNSVFLYHCTKAGLDLAIVNSEKLVRFSQISDEEKQLCDRLLWYTDEYGDPVANFAAYFREKKVVATAEETADLPVEKRLEINIVQGTKEGLIQNLDDALQQWTPLEVINKPLMAGMDIVGQLFGNNELIVAEVLQSAEVMKAAVGYLETFMEKTDITVKGTMLLATVKGDVHDIGKNLVYIILSNNGYKIIDLGIKCPPETLIAACKEHNPDMIGLSGLLVKSAQQMVITAGDLKNAGIDVPILVGGAALSEAFTINKITPEYPGPVIYCRDAMTGLSVANQLTDPVQKSLLIQSLKTAALPTTPENTQEKTPRKQYKNKLVISHDTPIPTPPSFKRIVIEKPLPEVWNLVNPQMLYGNHLGLKGNVLKLIADGDAKAVKLTHQLNDLKSMILEKSLLRAKAVYQFFKVRAEKNHILLYDEAGKSVINSFHFPRQSDGYQLCLSDFVSTDKLDTICLFVATCGEGVADIAKQWMDKGDYFNAHAISALALESAEGLSECIHQEIRNQWGFPDASDIDAASIFKLKYRGVRFSFGYPACPRLEDQAKLWELMAPDNAIGVTLSEEMMMAPEASVSAMVFHHPQTRYFSISDEDMAVFESKIN